MLPKSEINLFLHLDLALKAIDRGWLKFSEQLNIVYVTHLSGEVKDFSVINDAIDFILVNNTETLHALVLGGVDKNRILVTPNPISEEFKILSTKLPNRDVVFVCNYYLRKRPDLILQTVTSLPDVSFTLIGKNWEGKDEFSLLSKQDNFVYKEFDFQSYPEDLRDHRIYCSLSNLEGGPVPLLEALVAGLNVVCTDTGTARDLIPKEFISNILPTNPNLDLIKKTIKNALLQDSPKFEKKKHYFYQGFVELIEEKMIQTQKKIRLFDS
jgi:glycosyltransferase involved in cell wall biosynthesis